MKIKLFQILKTHFKVFFSILLCIRLKKERLHIFSRIINISPKKYLQNICSGSSNDQNPRENVVFGLKGISSKVQYIAFFITFHFLVQMRCVQKTFDDVSLKSTQRILPSFNWTRKKDTSKSGQFCGDERMWLDKHIQI